jgi:hypothetical protein
MARSKKTTRNALNALPSLINASAKDAANMQMRQAGRTIWDESDYNLAAQTQHRLMQACYGFSGDGPHMAAIRYAIAVHWERGGHIDLYSDWDDVLGQINEAIAQPVAA